MQNAGKATHRIKRLMTAISNIRDRSVQLATRLAHQRLTLEASLCCVEDQCHCCSSTCLRDDGPYSDGNNCGRVALHVGRDDKDYSVTWQICHVDVKGECRCRSMQVQSHLAILFDAASPTGMLAGAVPNYVTLCVITLV